MPSLVPSSATLVQKLHLALPVGFIWLAAVLLSGCNRPSSHKSPGVVSSPKIAIPPDLHTSTPISGGLAAPIAPTRSGVAATSNTLSTSTRSLDPTPVPEKSVFRVLTRSPEPLRLPGPARRPPYPGHLATLASSVDKNPTAAGFRSLGDRCREAREYTAAARAYRQEASIRRIKGQADAAEIQDANAARYETSLQLFVKGPASTSNYHGARLEPVTGCYLGAFIDRADPLKRYWGDNWQTHALPTDFARRIKRRHATFFTYAVYGSTRDGGGRVSPSFPSRWLRLCKSQGVIPHIAWEPRRLTDVRDDAYLKACAKTLRQLDWPVFIRFASEMNGKWTPYHGDPALYRQKFRLVARVLRQAAPKVAMIWCPNAVPLKGVDNYYPGDDACDWVGVNIYSTPFLDNDPARSAFFNNPLDMLQPIYERYAARKPIAICEYGASHQSRVDNISRPQFAIEKMQCIYSALPRLYPGVKMINWFSSNTIRHAPSPSRRLNNYDLLANPSVSEAYRKVTATSYFFGSWRESLQKRPPVYDRVRENHALPLSSELSVWVKTYPKDPVVVLLINETTVYVGRGAGAHDISLQLPDNGQSFSMTVLVFGEQNRFIESRRWSVRCPSK